MRLNLDISQRVYALMQERGLTESDLARALEISEAGLGLRLSGTYDWRLRELVRLEVVLERKLIMLKA